MMPPFPGENSETGLVVLRTDHAFGLDLIAITLTTHEFPRYPTTKLVETALGRAPPFNPLESRDPALVGVFHDLFRSGCRPTEWSTSSPARRTSWPPTAGPSTGPSKARARSTGGWSCSTWHGPKSIQ